MSTESDWRFSPMRAADLAGLPPTFLVTAEFDPLRDQGLAYGEALAAAGVPVDSRCYEGVFHGFFGMREALDPAKEAFDDAATALRGALRTRRS